MRIDILLHHEEIWQAQRAKIHWLIEGDKNTKFFHQKATQRKNHSRITDMDKGNDEITFKEEEIQSILIQFYKNQFITKALSIHDDWTRKKLMIGWIGTS